MASIDPFLIAVPQSDLDDLRKRLAETRWPATETADDVGQGPRLAKLQALAAHWVDIYDWRACEAQLNAWGSMRTVIDGLGIHFLHVRSPRPDALPLLLLHGWPGSILEFRKLIGPLTDPAAYGADTAHAFELVIPSMPGFGFSEKPTEIGWDIARIARAYVTLMERMGFPRWAVQGGDFGACVADEIAALAPSGLVGLHSNFTMFVPTAQEIEEADANEQAMLASMAHFGEKLSAYISLQSTRPQTIGYALADSPIAQAAWVYAMFQDTCGTPGNAEASFSYDEMLDDIMLYWLTNSGVSSARLYWELVRSGWQSPAQVGQPITVPTGFSMFAGDALRKSRRWIERRYSGLRFFADHARGGHFAALERPDAMIGDIRATFADLR